MNGMAKGLTAEEVIQRRQEFGENRLPEERGVSAWKILINQLKSPLIYIIVAAAVISLAVGEVSDFFIILLVIIVDVILGFFQEFQAQKTYLALKGLLYPKTTVLRDGIRQEIEFWELVPGDLVILNAGEKVPGDGILIETTNLSVDESILTGESESVIKQPWPGGIEYETKLALEKSVDPIHMAYMGTTVGMGRGIMRVNAIGLATELGKIAASLVEQSEADTPFQIRLKTFSRFLTRAVIGCTIVIFMVGLASGEDFVDMLRTAIILAIAAVPEGLLIAVTVILVLGMRKILNRNGLVKRLLAVETLGSVTVICTDKTGTLTEGRMRVSRVDLMEKERAMETMVYCNNLEGPVDVALWEYAKEQLQVDPQTLVDQSNRLAEELFTSESKYMIVQMACGRFEKSNICFMKGAPEIVMAMCDLNEEQRESTMHRIDDWAGEGLRLLGLAYRENGSIEDRWGYRWAGFIGMEDPIRKDVRESVQLARQAGIRIKMITGDYRKTAEQIAGAIGMLSENSQTIEGAELAVMTDEVLGQRVKETDVFARIRPQEKYRIINALQKNGQVTAMIGDGVNDAPALKCANIGVVVGTATEVAKETADLILLDNHFNTIVAAIEEGRIIFANVRKVIAYMLSNSFAEVLTIFIAMIMNWPTPLLVAQILWIHLICDGPADIVLGFEPKEEGIMKEGPRSLEEPILTRLAIILIVVISTFSALFALYQFHHIYHMHQNVSQARSVVFASLAINSMVYIFAYRSLRVPIYRMNKLTVNKPLMWSVMAGILTVLAAFWIPWLRQALGLVSLTMADWLFVIGFALFLLMVVEIAKAIANRLAYKEIMALPNP